MIKLFLCLLLLSPLYAQNSLFQKDGVKKRLSTNYVNSHIKVFFPSLPYVYVSRLVNAALVRPSDNKRGWEYDLATKVEQKSATVYELSLREGVLFQDKSAFSADSVINNFALFMQSPFKYTNIDKTLKKVEKISTFKVRFILYQPYSMFLHDLARINIYSNSYLKRYGWEGGVTGDSQRKAGPYGLGPYILSKGSIIGKEQSKQAILVKNPYYWDKSVPLIEKITIYTELESKTALEMLLEKEQLDVMPIPFNQKINTIISPYAKLLITPSTNNFTIHMNMLKPKGALKHLEVRRALNFAINQKKLLNFVYKNEGFEAPTALSINYPGVKEANLKPLYKQKKPSEQELKKVLNGLELVVATQDRFMFLWKGIEYQLKKYGVKLSYTITQSEKDIYQQLLTNRQAPKEWDLLIWGNDDWYGMHPWNVIFTYRTASVWSSIDKDERLQSYLNTLFQTPLTSKRYEHVLKKIMQRVQERSYMLFVPAPNKVIGVNKELFFTPSKVGIYELWKAKLGKYHYSLRQGAYPKPLQKPIFPQRFK